MKSRTEIAQRIVAALSTYHPEPGTQAFVDRRSISARYDELKRLPGSSFEHALRQSQVEFVLRVFEENSPGARML